METSNMADAEHDNYGKIDFCTLGMFIIGMRQILFNTGKPLNLSR